MTIVNCTSCFVFSEKLNVELDVIKNSVEGLVNLLLESCKHKVRLIETKVCYNKSIVQCTRIL